MKTKPETASGAVDSQGAAGARARNPLHDHPLLRKAARHEKTGKARRRADKVRLAREWLPQCVLSNVRTDAAIRGQLPIAA